MATSRVADEREQRRGLVLGLTLAEVLLLLLFLLLLALAKQFGHLQEEAKRHAALSSSFEQLKALQQTLLLSGVADAATIEKLVVRFQKLEEAEREVDRLRKENSVLVAESTLVKSPGLNSEEKVRAIAGVMQRAAAINPNDPPALLKRALDVLNKLGTDTQPDQVKPLSQMVADVELGKKYAAMEAAQRGTSGSGPAGHQWPPIITLSEAGGFAFAKNSAELSPAFSNVLLNDAPSQILEYIKKYNVDVIEVVGHTDEQPIAPRTSNLDRDLLSVLNNTTSVASLTPADNAGLGLARAVSVVRALRQNEKLKPYRIIALSGAQLITTDERLVVVATPGDIPQRRRIEIRLRKSIPNDVTAVLPVPTAVAQPPSTPAPKHAVPPTRPAAKQEPTVLSPPVDTPPMRIAPSFHYSGG